MINRITIAIDTEIEKELRTMQAELIKKTNKSVSISKVLNDILKKGLNNGHEVLEYLPATIRN